MKFIGIIPARYESSRFPGKPLVEIKGKPMIQRTWEQARKALDNVVIATDDERIREVVDFFGGTTIMTSAHHLSGTERCAEAADKLSSENLIDFDVVINIQGDEPFIQPEQITLLKECFNDRGVEIATLIKKIDSEGDIFNENTPKVIFNKLGNAIYFSRSPIPFIRGRAREEWILSGCFFRHIGMYAYTKEVLAKIVMLKPGMLELAESLEQNRWLENGYMIRVKETFLDTISIDTPEDLEKII